MYTIKYRPNKLSDFIGNKKSIQPFVKWLLEWNTNYLPDKNEIPEKNLKKSKSKKVEKKNEKSEK
jgi:hypothetical protein